MKVAARDLILKPAKGKSMLSFSIVVNTFNRVRSLRQTLEGLAALDYPLFEIVVVNGPSDDGTNALLEEYAGKIKIVSLTERNLSKSRNLGIAAADGDIVAFIDDDAYPDPAWLDRMAEGYDRAEVAAVGGPTYDHTGYNFQEHFIISNRLGESWSKGPEFPNPADLFCRPFSMLYPRLMGTNSSFRRNVLVEIGGFDEEFDYYLDETDLCLRLIDHGYVIRLLNDGYVYHKFLASHLRTPARRLHDRFSVVKNKVYFALKNGMGHVSFQDIYKELLRFVEWHRNDIRINVSWGFLTEEDFERFEADVSKAFDVGLERFAARGSGNPPADWFAERRSPFLAFAAVRPARKLHLCFFSVEYPPAVVNGISRFTHEIAVGLAERGHHVHVLTRGSDCHRVDLEEGVWVHRLVPSERAPPAQLVVPPDVWDYSATLYDQALRIHRHTPLDFVQVPLWDSEGIAAVLGSTIPVILSVHTPLPVALRINPHWSKDAKAFEARLKPLVALEAYCLEHSGAILANSTAIMRDIADAHGEIVDPTKVTIVPHGFGKSLAVRETGTGGRPLCVLFVGRLERRKGIDVLLACIPDVIKQFPDIQFDIVGDDAIPAADGVPYRKTFEADPQFSQVQRNVQFTGRVDEQQLDAFYRNCDIFVAPSRYESFGLIYIEAMRHGKPVVGCSVGGVPEVVAAGDNGLLVSPGDAAALANAIVELARDSELRRRMGRRSAEIYETQFTRAKMIDALEQFYVKLLDEPLRRPGEDGIAARGMNEL